MSVSPKEIIRYVDRLSSVPPKYPHPSLLIHPRDPACIRLAKHTTPKPILVPCKPENVPWFPIAQQIKVKPQSVALRARHDLRFPFFSSFFLIYSCTPAPLGYTAVPRNGWHISSSRPLPAMFPLSRKPVSPSPSPPKGLSTSLTTSFLRFVWVSPA